MYLYHNHKLPKLFNHYFKPVSSVHNYNTRNASHKNYQLYSINKVNKVKDIYHLEMAKFMYLYHNHKLPKLFNHYFKPVNSVHNYNTRNASHKNYQLYSIHSNTAKKALPFSGAQIWNNLHPEWKDFSYYRFKKLSNVTLLRIITKSLYQSTSSNLMRGFCKKVFFFK